PRVGAVAVQEPDHGAGRLRAQEGRGDEGVHVARVGGAPAAEGDAPVAPRVRRRPERSPPGAPHAAQAADLVPALGATDGTPLLVRCGRVPATRHGAPNASTVASTDPSTAAGPPPPRAAPPAARARRAHP